MSAYMVDKTHIDLLVKLALDGPREQNQFVGMWQRPYFNGSQVPRDGGDDLGEALVKENLSSIHYRYPDTLTNPNDTPGPIEQYWLQPYKYVDPGYEFTAAEALEAIAGYEYQTCEHPEWTRSTVREFCNVLRARVAAYVPGVKDAPWEWTEAVLREHRVA